MTVSAIGSHSASGSISANTASQSLRLRAAKTASIGALIARCRSDIDLSIHGARTERRAARLMAARELPRFARVAAGALRVRRRGAEPRERQSQGEVRRCSADVRRDVGVPDARRLPTAVGGGYV